MTAAVNRWMSMRAGPVRCAWIAALPLLAVLGALNLVAVAGLINATLHQPVPLDWLQFRMAGERIAGGVSPYAMPDPWTFRWSPLAAWLLLPLTALGPAAWMVAQFAVLLALPRRVALLALLTFPYWADVFAGNIMTFTLVLAVLALRGSRIASLAYIALVFLVPRPLMVPVAAWLLWKRPELRAPAALIFAANVVLVAATGYGAEWIHRLLTSGDEIGLHNAGPSALIGPWWIPIGLALAVLFTWRGRLGLASLAASPYLILYYWIFAFLELVTPVRRLPRDGRAAVSRPG